MLLLCSALGAGLSTHFTYRANSSALCLRDFYCDLCPGVFFFFASVRRVVHMGMGFTSVCLMAEPLRLPMIFAFYHTFLLSWVTLD